MENNYRFLHQASKTAPTHLNFLCDLPLSHPAVLTRLFPQVFPDIFPSSVDKSNLHDGSLMNIHLPVLYLFADILTIHFDIPIPENTYDRYVVSYTSVVLGESSGLRAPPYFFS